MKKARKKSIKLKGIKLDPEHLFLPIIPNDNVQSNKKSQNKNEMEIEEIIPKDIIKEKKQNKFFNLWSLLQKELFYENF